MTRSNVATAVLLTALALSASPAAGQAQKEVILPEGARPSRLLSPLIRVGDLLFLSGSLGTVPGQGMVEGGVQAETRQIIANIERTLATAGATLEDLVKCTVFLADMEDYSAMNEVYIEMIPNPKPARSAVAVTGLAIGARVEIECIAVAPAG